MPDTLRLLCVDDEEHILKTLARFCHNEGITLLTAGSAAEALSILEREPVMIVISDYQMPEKNGLDFLSEVRSKWPQIIRIMLSGFIEPGAVSHALQQGEIFAFLPKPWQRSDLKNLIQTAAVQYKAGTATERTPR
ncbi:response regulator [Trichlorobacter lovleyi]|uniref:response regulator n=1 Tax=Trichlorobacter lovleyi TaxID=313985 RepID=UPI002480B42E|nr:response regulator [Trichlorobacter lovleyi]